MKRIFWLFNLVIGISLVIGLSLALGLTVDAASPVWSAKTTVKFSGGSRTVQAVYADLNDPNVRIEMMPAQGIIGKTDTLGVIAERAKDNDTVVEAAINATYFDAYSNTDKQPFGHVLSKGELQHFISNSGTFGGFTADNQFMLDNLYVSIQGSINGCWDYPYAWSTYGINHISTGDFMLTPKFGSRTGNRGNSTLVVVNEGVVTAVTRGDVAIPTYGYVLVFNTASVAAKFEVGQRIDYRIDFNQAVFNNGTPSKGIPIDMEAVRSGFSAGPMLLKDGVVSVNPLAEGIKEAKITTQRAQRSFIGVKKDNTLVMGTVSDVTVKELAEILKSIGVVNATNLDGGASSGLYFRGSYLTKPGRNISNAIVVTRKKTTPLRLSLNGKELLLDVDPYIKNQRTMVPLRAMMEAMGAKITLDPEPLVIHVEKSGLKLDFKIGSDKVTINGRDKLLGLPVELRNGRTFVPVRFLVELLGGSVDMEPVHNRVELNLDINQTAIFYSLSKLLAWIPMNY